MRLLPLLLLPVLGACVAYGSSVSTAADSTEEAEWDTLAGENERRTYNGTRNNLDQPEWGSVGQRQLRSITEASYADGVSEPPGDDRPTAREVLSEVFLANPSTSSTANALFVGWGLLVGYDLFLTQDNASEPLDIACNDAEIRDVWCPLGSLSDPIPFSRSKAGEDAGGEEARSPINYATAFVDLDWLYGRDEATSASLRTEDGGYMNMTDDELPHLLDDGTWLVADQRPARLPVTFALMTLLLREHNRCCDEMAPEWDPANDEDTFQFCRQWTIAVFQHITENDWSVRFVGGSIKVLGAAAYDDDDHDDDDHDDHGEETDGRRRRRRLGDLENVVRSRYLTQSNGSYDAGTDAGTDVFFATVAAPALYSALPSTVGLLDDGFEVMAEHEVELATANADLAGLVTRIGGIEPIIRGASYARARGIDASFVAEVSVSSPLFNFPVEVIQRGRDHGVPSYNDAREAYGLSRFDTFAEITSDTTVQATLSAAYGNDADLLDAYTGALAETEEGSGLFAGPLLRMVFLEQLYRAIVGDRHHHSHSTQNEDAALSTLQNLILNNSLVSSIPLDSFSAPDLVTSSNCSSTEMNEVTLAEGYKLAWNQSDLVEEGGYMFITLSARGIEGQGMIAIGFGGLSMETADDFVICVVESETTAECTDRSAPRERSEPPLDDEENTDLDVVSVSVDGEWTSVTFARSGEGTDDSDYLLSDDIYLSQDTSIIYSWRSGDGIGKHPNSQRGAAQVNFQDGSVADEQCSDSGEYYSLHGALLLVAWMIIAPYGIYQARYRKGKKSFIGNQWWEMHQECMVICAEALLPLAITAVFTTSGSHNSEHAKWGFYMVGAIVLQIGTGFARVRALEAKSNNFSLFHRVNKHFHISAGWFAYAAGLVQCYRGLELVSGSDKLIFSAVDINFTLGNFQVVQKTLFPVWLGIIPPIFLVLEVRKQARRFFTKGAARLCCFVELVNEKFTDEAIQQEVDNRLMPRTEELPIYTMQEFNEKVLNGRSWVIVDGAVLNVSDFAKRHPGGMRLIINAMGTDVTSEFLGENASVRNPGTVYEPHPHTDTALEIARSLVVGYIEEEDDMEETYTSEAEAEGGGSRGGGGFGCGGRSGSGDGYASDYRRKASLSSFGAASDGSSAEAGAPATPATCRNSRSTARRSFVSSTTTTPRAYSGSSRASTPAREQTASLGRPGPFLDNDDTGKSNDSDDSYSGRGGSFGGVGGVGGGGKRLSVRGRARNKSCSGSDESGSDGGEKMRGRSSLSRRVSVGIPKISRSKTVELSSGRGGEPSAAVAAGPAVKLSAEASAILNARSPPEAGSDSSARTGRRTAAPGATATAEGAPLTLPPHHAPTLKRFATAPMSTVGGEGWQGKPKELICPLASDRDVSPRWMEPALPEKPAVVIKAAGARMLKRLGSQIEFFGASGDESDSKQEDSTLRTPRRVARTRNPLHSFHVCPLLLHEKLCDGGGRPVHKFVFACPGTAAGLVGSMEGVCHFNMRLAQEAGMTVVQRAYNAFAVRVLDEEGKRRVVPALESSEGVLCVEMRIRLYPDGLMSGLLAQLIKNLDNPAVQLQGPFLQHRLTPPPAHRNVVMIAAGTGVNPMLQMIRDHLTPGSRSHSTVTGVHSRLVLLWQNSVEADLYCTDELTALQAKGNGLLEVTALISGDNTRRNIPGNAFRRAKARLMKKGAAAGLVPRGEREVDSDAGDAKNDDDDALPADLPRLWSVSELSRVSEEDSSHTRGSKSTRSLGLFASAGSRDLETGGGGGGGDLSRENTIGEAEREGVDVPWPASHTAADTRSKVGKHRQHGDGGGGGGGGGGGLTTSSSAAAKSSRSTSFAGGAHIWSEEEAGKGQKSRSDNDGVPRGTLIAGRRGSGGGSSVDTDWRSTRRKSPARNSTGGPSGSSGDGLGGDSARSGIRVADSIRAAGLERGHWSKKKSRGSNLKLYSYPDGDDGGGCGGGSGGGRSNPTAPRFHPSYRSKVGTRDGVADDSSGNGQGRARKTFGARRKGRRWASRDRSAMRGAGQPGGSPLDDSGTGLQQSKLTVEILERALGEPVMAAVVAAKKAEARVPANSELHPPYNLNGMTDALRELVGTETSSGRLQVVVSGPGGFVFHVEGLLADLHIPPEAVVTLD